MTPATRASYGPLDGSAPESGAAGPAEGAAFVGRVAGIICDHGRAGLELRSLDLASMSVGYHQNLPDARVPLFPYGDATDPAGLPGWAPAVCSPGWAHLAFLLWEVAPFADNDAGGVALVQVQVAEGVRAADLLFSFAGRLWAIEVALEGRPDGLEDAGTRVAELFETGEHLRLVKEDRGGTVVLGEVL